MTQYRLNTLFLITGAVALALGSWRVWFRSEWPQDLEQKLAASDTLRIRYHVGAPDGRDLIASFVVTDLDDIKRIRGLLNLRVARKVEDGGLVMGGPSLEVTAFRREEELITFHVVDSLLITPAYPTYNSCEYALDSGDAWSALLELCER